MIIERIFHRFESVKIVMGITSELGPIDPQLAVTDGTTTVRRFSVYNVINGRPIYRDEASDCGIKIESIDININIILRKNISYHKNIV